ncbi:hypothetical protein [Actinoallomurus bryophytorum]|nr:hypothetical protein [Actinoallomurus bryophytorum]
MGLAGGVGFPGTNEDGASAEADRNYSYGDQLQPMVADFKGHAASAVAAVDGNVSTAMAQQLNQPEGPLDNLDDHHKGARVGAVILKGPVAIGVPALKITKIVDAAVTLTELAISAMTPGGQLAIPEVIASGRFVQNGATNAALNFFMGGSGGGSNSGNTAAV